jgi:outer membrane protein assembly factor BamB
MRDTGGFFRRRVLKATALTGLTGGLAGCNETGTADDSSPVPEPEEPPTPLQEGVDLDALRSRTARAIAEEAFSVTGVVSYLRGGEEVRSSQAKTGYGNPDAETALHVTGRSGETALDEPREADSFVERYFGDGTVFGRVERDGNAEYERDEGGYGAFTDRVLRDLDALYEVGTSFEFGNSEWNEDEAAYVVEGVGIDGDVAEEAAIESCRLSVNADGVVVGIDVTLSAESEDEDQQVRARIDGEAGIAVSVEEPDWIDEVEAGAPAWTYQTGERPTSTVEEERVYVASSTGVAAVDRFDGTETWQFPASAPRLTHAVADGTVYVGGYEDAIYALDAADGSERWQQSTDEPVGAPVVSNDVVVYFGSEGIYGFEAGGGTPRWSVTLEGSLGRLVDDGTLYVGGTSGTVHALDAATGDENWRFEPRTRNWVQLEAVVDGRVYAGGFDGGVYCIDAADGTGVWEFSTADAIASVAVAGGGVYVGNRAGEVYALNADNGAEAWRFEAGDTARVHPDGEAAYVASHDGTFRRLSADDGTEEWAFETGDWVEHPAVTDDAIYFSSRDANLYAIDPAEGTEHWARELNFWARSAPVVRNDLLYVTDLGRGRGTVFAFDTYEA